MTEVKIELDTLLVCRVCLQNAEDELEMASIFDRDTQDSALCLYEKIENCGDIKILTDPELPTRICNKCIAFLTIAHKFRIMCRNSDNYLREFVCKKTRSSIDEEDGIPEYLMEYNPEPSNSSAHTSVVQVLQEAGHDIIESQPVDYEELEGYTELWLHQNEDDIIEEDADAPDSQQSEHSTTPPAKTLDISSDGAAVIRMKTQRQINKEKQLHICEICGNSYPRKYALEAHMRRHRNERPFECEICQQSFHLNFQLTRHIRKHTGIRPYTCQYCKRSFADRSTMVKHERIHRNERPYKCETCGKSFTYSSVLKVHMLTHTGEKPFNCGICGKRFARAHHLRAHLETLLHSNDPRSKVLLKQIKREEYYNCNEDYASQEEIII